MREKMERVCERERKRREREGLMDRENGGSDGERKKRGTNGVKKMAGVREKKEKDR